MPQKTNELLKEVGEKTVLYHLIAKTIDSCWQVHISLSDPGCDIILWNELTNKKVLVEVKTRQRIYVTGEHERFMFKVTDFEYQHCDFLIAYWFEMNYLFIVPKDKLKMGTEWGGTRRFWKLQINPKSDGSLDSYSEQFIERWDLLFGLEKIAS